MLMCPKSVGRLQIVFMAVITTLRGNEIADCLNEVLLKYFKNSTLLIYDGQNARSFRNEIKGILLPENESSQFFDVNIITKQLSKDVWTIHLINSRYLRTLHPLTKNKVYTAEQSLQIYYSVFIFGQREADDYDRMANVFEQIKNSELYKRQYRTIIMLHGSSGTGRMAAKNAIDAIWRWMKTAEVLVMVVIKDKVWFYTWMPYTYPDCNQVKKVTLLNKWTKGRFEKTDINLFPRKIPRDLMGCPLKVMTDECLPYTQPENIGLESRLIESLSEHFNFTLDKVEPEKGSVWSTFDKNGSLSGSFYHLYRQEIDFSYACFMLNLDRYRIAENLPSYFDDSLSWFVAFPDRIPHTTDVFVAFDGKIWVSIVFTIFISNFTVFWITFYDKVVNKSKSSFSSVLLRFIFFSINTPTTFKTTSLAFRMIIIMYSLYSLNVTTAYQSSLYSLYRTQRYKKMYETIRETLSDDLFVYLSDVNRVLYNQTDHDLWNKILVPGRHAYEAGPAEISSTAENKNATILYIKSTMQYIIQKWLTDEETHLPQLVLIPKRFVSYPVTFYLAPGHPLHFSFYQFILNMGQAGIVQLWLRDIIKGFEPFHLKVLGQSPLSFEHLSGPLYIWGLILAIATFFFLLEVLFFHFCHWEKKKKFVEVTLGEMINQENEDKRKRVVYVTRRLKV